MKDYSILVNSTSKISGSNATDLTYRFDWTLFGEGEYDLSFVFLSAPKTQTGSGIINPDQAVKVELEVPFSSDRYKSSVVGGAPSSNVIGFIQMVGVDGFVDRFPLTSYAIRQWKSIPDNHTIRLYGRPSGNEFKVRLLQNNNSLAGHFPAQYLLMLKLVKVR